VSITVMPPRTLVFALLVKSFVMVLVMDGGSWQRILCR
jgi:hypothetical protein